MTSPFRFTRGAGGKFTGSVGGVPMPPSMAALYSRLGAEAGGSLSFNGKRGTGYGVKGGDARVRMLQTALNNAGFGDGTGHRLDVDGQLGPLTTAAVKAAQHKLGVPANGVVTPKLLAQILRLPKGKQLPARTSGKKRTAREMMAHHSAKHKAAPKHPAKHKSKPASKAPATKPAPPRIANRGYAI